MPTREGSPLEIVLLTKSEKKRALFLDAFSLSFLLGVIVWLFIPDLDKDNFNFSVAIFVSSGVLFLGFLTAYAILKTGKRTLGIIVFAKPDPTSAAPSILGSFWGAQLIVVLLVMLLVGSYATEVSLRELFDQRGVQGALNIFRGLVHPKISLFPQAVFAIVQTIFTAFIATVAAIPIAFVLSFFAAKNIVGNSLWEKVFYFTLRAVFNLLRSIEPVSWAIIFSVWVGVGPFAGMLALFLHSVASLTKQYAEQIECVVDGPIEGIQATGASKLQVIWFGIVPQVVLPFVSFTIFRWDINVRMATIVGLTGGGGIGTLLFQYQNQANWQAVGMIVIVIAAVVWLMDTGSSYLREALK